MHAFVYAGRKTEPLRGKHNRHVPQKDTRKLQKPRSFWLWGADHCVIIKQMEILLLNAPLSRVIYLHFTRKTETMPHKINWSMVIWAFAV